MQKSKERIPEAATSSLGKLMHDTGATTAELRQFLAQMRGKSPQEVMGTIAGNSLVKSTLLAAVAIVVFLLLTSTVVYLVTPDKSKAAKAKANPAAQAKTSGTAAADGNTALKSDATEAASDETIASGDKALDTLGIGETKISAPDKNPLEDKFDDLLDKKID